MISWIVALPLVLVVQAHNLHGEVTVQVVSASVELIDFIYEDATHMSSCLPLLL